MPRLREAWEVLRESFAQWSDDNGARLGAALAFYTFFSLAPLLVIVIAIAGLVLGPKAAEGRIVAEIQHLVGLQSAKAIEWLILKAQRHSSGWAGLVGICTLFIGASGVVSELQNAFDQIWKSPRRVGMRQLVIQYAWSYVMVLGLGFVALVSLLANVVLAAIGRYFTALLPLGEAWLHLASEFVTFAGITGLFGIMFHWLPQIRPSWRHVWPGAVFTALLFTAGKFLLALYLGKTAIGSMYGAAGSLAIVMLWVYYSAQILYLGAEFTKVISRRPRATSGIRRQGEQSAERDAVLTTRPRGASDRR